MRVDVCSRLDEIPPADWDALVGTDNPFVEHTFLALLEATACVSGRSGWTPVHLLVRDDAMRLVGALPCYRRSNSNGEYIFDWSWAEASMRAGIAYYPKLTCAVPFTPATGPRLLVHPDADKGAVRAALAAAMVELARQEGCSSCHVLFCRDDEADALVTQGFARRTSLQFHWRNAGWPTFEAYLESFRHDERKQVRRERRRVVESGVEVQVWTGDEVPRALWPELFALYTSMSARKWGRPYLTSAFFDEVPRVLGNRAVVAAAFRDRVLVAMTLSFEKGRHIYGRYWGAHEEIPGLHFELCYYRLVDRALARGATLVEAGAQGEHKLKRGFLPVMTHSAHAFLDPRLDGGIRRFLVEEEAAVRAEQAELLLHGPFKDEGAPARLLIAGIDDL